MNTFYISHFYLIQFPSFIVLLLTDGQTGRHGIENNRSSFYFLDGPLKTSLVLNFIFNIIIIIYTKKKILKKKSVSIREREKEYGVCDGD